MTERYCFSDGTAASESVTCANGCSDGKCNPPTCSDSDGAGYTTASTTTGLFAYDTDALGVPPATQVAKNYADVCTSTTMLKEYKCSSINNNFVVFDQKNCASLGAGYTCSNGACAVPAAPAVEICDGIDNTNNGIKDEGCDDDNDNYCDSAMTRASSYSCSGSTNCCNSGGGDCDDNLNIRHPGYTSDPCIGSSFNVDNDCDGQIDEECEVCDNQDNDNDGQIDEECDKDNDDYCDRNMGIIGTPSTCTGGGGDCRDYVGNENVNPGAEENCFDYGDNNCNNQYQEGCVSYFCIDNEPTNDPTIGGTITLTASVGPSITLADSCKDSGISNETICLTASSNNYWNLYSFTITSCPEGTTCNDPDGSAGATPGVCGTPSSGCDSDNDCDSGICNTETGVCS